MGYIFDNVKVFASESADLNEAMKDTEFSVADTEEALKILNVKVKSFDYKPGFVVDSDVKNKYYGIIKTLRMKRN